MVRSPSRLIASATPEAVQAPAGIIAARGVSAVVAAVVVGRYRAPVAVAHPDEPEMRVSHETIYQSLFAQGRGELRRELGRRR